MYYIIVDLNNIPYRYQILDVNDEDCIVNCGFWGSNPSNLKIFGSEFTDNTIKLHDWCKLHKYTIFGTSESHPEFFI